jgi:hypothetical protein
MPSHHAIDLLLQQLEPRDRDGRGLYKGVAAFHIVSHVAIMSASASGLGVPRRGRSGFRSRHEHVLHLLPHWPNSEGLGEVLVDHVNRVTQRPDNFR